MSLFNRKKRLDRKLDIELFDTEKEESLARHEKLMEDVSVLADDFESKFKAFEERQIALSKAVNELGNEVEILRAHQTIKVNASCDQEDGFEELYDIAALQAEELREEVEALEKELRSDDEEYDDDD